MKILYIPVIAAIGALLPLSQDGYTLVRIVVCAFLLYAGFKVKSQGSPNSEKIGAQEASLICFVMAAVYNPIFPLYLSRGLWMVIDVVVAAFLIWFVNLFTTKSSQQTPYSSIQKSDFEEPGCERKKRSDKGDKLMSSVMWTSLVTVIVLLIFTFMNKGQS